MVQFFCKPLLILILAPAVLAQAPATPVISSVSFQGNQFVRSSQLRSLLQYSMEGRPYVPAYLSADLQNLEFIYKDKGFLQARVGPPEVQIQKEGNGGDHVAVAWQGPGITQTVIDGAYLAPYLYNFTDYTVFAAQWQKTNCSRSNAWCSGADRDRDGNVQLDDLAAFAEWWLYDSE